jgi:ferredoxin
MAKRNDWRNIIMNSELKLVYFSPTDTTKNILHKIADEMSFSISEEFNLTNYEYKDFGHIFEENDVILLGFPVYGGRVPKTAKNRFNGLKGNGAKIITILTYGDMHYDNSLIEIYELLKNNGFIIIGMAAFVSQHSIAKNIGFNRPNNEDYELLKYFARKLVEKINGNKISGIEIEVANAFGKYNTIPIKPKTKNNCSGCGLCIKLCPENAIKNDNLRTTDKNKCICCIRCIKYCPNKARNLTTLEYFVSKIFLKIVRKIKYKKVNNSEVII